MEAVKVARKRCIVRDDLLLQRILHLRVLPFERQNVGDNTHFAGEFPGILESAVVNELDEKGREPSAGFTTRAT
jgi:hypothetical protein